MDDFRLSFARHVVAAARTAFVGPQLFAFIPALMLVGYWYGGEAALIFLAVALPAIVALVGTFLPTHRVRHYPPSVDAVTGLPLRDALIEHLDNAFTAEPDTGLRTLCVVLDIDDFSQISRDHGEAAVDAVLRQMAERLTLALRAGDTLVRLDAARFAIALAPTRRADLETTVQVAARLQATLSDPVLIDGLRLFLSASVGFCLPQRAAERSGADCLAAAEQALAEAQATGRGAIRAFTTQPRRKRIANGGLLGDVEAAMEAGQIAPWFQPQLSTDTGQVSGVEALARWQHPEHGLILPGAFLPVISAAGLTARLGEIVLFQALSALSDWDKVDLFVPSVGVNFSMDDLSDPRLTEKISWELDRFNLSADRLTVEVLETVVAETGNDIITRNIAQLAELGCRIDLDDFGTGHASIANIRRFFVNRIKIDRTFVSQVDADRQQQQMLAAILELAGRLRIETLAEGVETMGEHALLAQLGCTHVQGYHIAKPMPVDDLAVWLRKHQTRQAASPRIPKKTG